MQDLRYAVRLLFRAPGYSITALGALALGLGATIAIFSVVYAVLFRPLAISSASRLVVPVSVNPVRGFDRASVPYADYADWREQRDIFDAVAVYQPTGLDVSGDETPERVQAAVVSEDYFAVMEATPAAGRVLQPADHAADAARVVVISEHLWRRRYGADPALVGKDIRVAGGAVTVAGIVASERVWPLDVDVWLPLVASRLPVDILTRRDNMIFQSVARLRDGVTLEEGRTRVRDIAARVEAEHAASRRDWSTNLLPLRESLIEPEVQVALAGLLGGAGLVLLIACMNLANLLLARGTDRAREIAMRAALGASRRRIVRQLMVENTLLAAAGGAAGLLVASWLVGIVSVSAADVVPLADTIRLDLPVVLSAIFLVGATVVLFGLAPALTTSSSGSFQALRESRGVAGGGRARRLRDSLAAAEIAVAVMLLVAAGLTARSFMQLLDVDPGVEVDRVLTGRVTVPSARYPTPAARAQFWDALLADIRTLPGVEAAAAASYVPAGARGFGLGRVFLLDGQPEPPASADHPANWNVVTLEYFQAAGIRVLRGRPFTDRDTASSTPVIVINETMARRVFGDRDPLGARMRSWRDENLLREVVGIVSDVRYNGIADEARSLVYVPHAQDAWGSLTLVVRTPGDPESLAAPVRRVVAARDPDLAVADLRPLREAADRSIATPRLAAWLFMLFAAAAALLAAIGIYGVLAYAVSRRGHEIAVRLALGATPAAVSSLVIRHGLLLIGAGMALGLAGAVAIGRLLNRILFEVQPFDVVTFALVPLLLGSIAVLACALPALRAARIEPLTALKAE